MLNSPASACPFLNPLPTSPKPTKLDYYLQLESVHLLFANLGGCRLVETGLQLKLGRVGVSFFLPKKNKTTVFWPQSFEQAGFLLKKFSSEKSLKKALKKFCDLRPESSDTQFDLWSG